MRLWRLSELWRLGSIQNRRNQLHERAASPTVWIGGEWAGALRVGIVVGAGAAESCRPFLGAGEWP